MWVVLVSVCGDKECSTQRLSIMAAMLVFESHPGTQEAEAGGLLIPSQLELQSKIPLQLAPARFCCYNKLARVSRANSTGSLLTHISMFTMVLWSSPHHLTPGI